jgi:hypothetical protein
MEFVEGEDRYLNLGVRVEGQFFSWSPYGARTGYAFVTAFEPIKRLIQFSCQERQR